MNPQETISIPGDPEQVQRMSAQYAAVAARAEEILSRLRAIETGIGPQIWRGEAADGFSALLTTTGPDLTALATSYGIASRALATYATDLATAQDAARAAQAAAATAADARDRAMADRDSARSDADRHAADAQAALDPGAAQAAEQRRAEALGRENTAGAAIDQAQQSLQAAERRADDAVSQRNEAAARCVRELDDTSRTAINNRNLAQTPAASDGPSPTALAGPFSLSDIGHAILDVAGLVPGIGEAADGINAAWYTAEGDYANAALSAAAMIPGIGMAATAARAAARASDVARSVNVPSPPAPRARPGGHLEGRNEIMVNDPTVTGRTITDIDRVEGGVLWEEKSATGAQNIDKWVQKHIDRKFRSYLEARQHLEGYEDAPVGFRFTEPGADPDFKAAVEKALNDLRIAHPDVDIRLDWGQ